MYDNLEAQKSPNLLVNVIYAAAVAFMLAALVNLIEIKRDLQAIKANYAIQATDSLTQKIQVK